MTTDRELLELAAKAAKKSRAEWDYVYCRSMGHMVTQAMMWNPLTDDGDALRLAVKLRICLGPNLQLDRVVAYAEDDPVQSEPYDPDPYAATRRAIVRAAYEIGKAMP